MFDPSVYILNVILQFPANCKLSDRGIISICTVVCTYASLRSYIVISHCNMFRIESRSLLVFFLKKHKIHEIVEHTVPRKVNLQDDFVSDWPDMSKVYFF